MSFPWACRSPNQGGHGILQAAGCGAQGPGKAAFDCPVLKMTIDHSENAGIEAVATNLYKEDRSIDGIDGIFLGKLFRLNFRLQDFVEKCAHDTAPSHVLGHAALGNWPDVSAVEIR